LSFPSITISPYDLILADLDGVVVVPPDLVDQVIEKAINGREVDEKCRIDLEKGRGVKETFSEHRGGGGGGGGGGGKK